MANARYNKGRELLLNGDIDMLVDTIVAYLIDTNDVAFSAAHDFVDDIAAAIVAGPVTLASKTTTNGVFDAADIVFPAVTGDVSEAIVIAKSTGSNATSPLIAFIDTATGLPATPNGGDINVAWNASGIFGI